MTTFYAILVGGTIHGKGGPSTAAVDGPAGPVTAADHIWRDITPTFYIQSNGEQTNKLTKTSLIK